uniref:Repressor domain protein n=1 Tax=Siphoviridae sp. ctBeL15 TaxID=2825374 RepID=A0A8S5UZU6_9CAUD|nr:MAG TPA: repressor domain protein [Siphoviridae sp. ctBeL15]
MNEMQVFNNPEFGEVRTIEENGAILFCGSDVAKALGYTNPSKAINDHCRGDLTKRYPIVDALGRTQGAIFIPESDLYRLVFSSKLPTAEKFTDWVTKEVLPSIRKTGGYALPKDYPAALRALADAEETKLRLLAENQQQAQVIADFEPIRQYVDTILESKGTMATSQIAADYGLTAQKLNKILHDGGIQRNVNGQWLLYAKHMGKGHTKSKTIQIIRSDGRPDTIMQTQWTQKGRLMIHEILTARGIEAVMDRRVQVCRE